MTPIKRGTAGRLGLRAPTGKRKRRARGGPVFSGIGGMACSVVHFGPPQPPHEVVRYVPVFDPRMAMRYR